VLAGRAAQVGGVSGAEVNRLELEALRRLDYRLHVPWEELRGLLRTLLAGGLVLGSGEVRRAAGVGCWVGRERRGGLAPCRAEGWAADGTCGRARLFTRPDSSGGMVGWAVDWLWVRRWCRV
jgi:hypothetical protein